ncbi:cysteine methyltransferase [Candidatus Woesearchaeota archaeon]|nr:MAG: cysteine methyltransferase [Candidatus Woesearchaeota archaeon ex4484_78]RLE46780.1 MAG: cysteine methyltransferase [Candidatus Woesearchaeota archaeon]
MNTAQKVYAMCKKIPKGKISTYGIIAKKIKTSPRAVGQYLKKNPYSPKIPCHRIVHSDGRIGGFFGTKKVKDKIKLLKKEGIIVQKGKIKDFNKKIFKF